MTVPHHMPELGRLSPTKFLVCVDQGETSRTALRFACIKAKKRGGLVDILHVTQPAGFQSLFSVADQIQADSRDEAESLMNRLSEEANALSGVTPSILLREGDVGQEILKAAVEDQGVNMIVLGVSPGQSKGKLVGWLSSQLGSELILPMMLVPGNLTDQQIDELS